MKILFGAGLASGALLGLAVWAAWEVLTGETIDVLIRLRSGV